MSPLYNTGSSYGPISKFFHWVVAVLVVLMLFSFFIDDIPNKLLRGIVFNSHKLIGLTIFSLMILRLLWALQNPKPLLPSGTKAWERWAEKSVHYLFYAALLLMPIAGWVGTVAAGHPPRLGSFVFNLPINKSEWLDELSFTVHNTLAFVILALVIIHVLAALFHFFVKKDKVLQRMWP